MGERAAPRNDALPFCADRSLIRTTPGGTTCRDTEYSSLLTIVVSKSDGRVVVLRNGVEIGRSVAEVNDDDRGSHVITLTSGRDGTPRQVYVGLPGHEEEGGNAIDEAIINRLRLPRAFYQAVRRALRPGTTILITQSPVGTSAGEPLTVMDAAVPQP